VATRTPSPADAAAAVCTKALSDERLVLFGLLCEVGDRLRRRLGAAMEAEQGISLTTFEVLVRIARSPEGRLTMSEVADQTVHTSGGTTRLIDRIEVAGLVRRAACPRDRRTTYVELTPAGVACLEAATATHLSQLDDELAGRLSATERDVLVRALTKLNEGPAACAG
jgi:MarR family transcriptional regulator, 2-MHQ and catechol-resistance regulon repressor